MFSVCLFTGVWTWVSLASGPRFPPGEWGPPSPVLSRVLSHVPPGRRGGVPLVLSWVLSKVLSEFLPDGRGTP